ncbi:MAG: sugar phosphate isomerase/epimerase [Planctomycetes bacterium]|nr:sugar phosphate isomerase/epimerase [Planctomycetota bacterium]
MKISMMTYTMALGLRSGEKFDAVELCKFTRELGLDGIDWVTTYHYTPDEIRRICDGHGLKTICHTFFADLNHPSPAGRAPGREAFNRGIEAAVILGTDKIMLPVAGRQDVPREQAFGNVMAGLEEVIGEADRAKITVTVEHFPSAFSPFVISNDVNRAISRLPQLRITYDNGNVTTGDEAPDVGFRRSAAFIVHAHFKDWQFCPPDDPLARKCLDGKTRSPALVGDGIVNQQACIKAMKQAGYKGYINFEYEGNLLSPREATVIGVKRMRDWIGQA